MFWCICSILRIDVNFWHVTNMSGLQKIIKHKISEITAAVQPFSKHVVIVCLKVSVNPGSEEGVI